MILVKAVGHRSSAMVARDQKLHSRTQWWLWVLAPAQLTPREELPW